LDAHPLSSLEWRDAMLWPGAMELRGQLMAQVLPPGPRLLLFHLMY
jgi:hypothetical protein